MALETPSSPPPLHGKCHLKFPFWFFAPFPNFFPSFMLADVLNRYYHLNQAKVPYFEKYQLNLGYLSDQGLCGENEEGDDGRELESYWGKLVQGRSTKVRDFLRYRSQPKFQPLWCFDVQRSCPVLVNLLSIPGLADWILRTTMWTETILYFVVDCK